VSRRRGDRNKNLVGFTLEDVHYALDIFRVREIINPLPIVPLPHAPPSVVGVSDYRGEVVMVLDVRRRFGLPPVAPTRRTKWVVVDVGAHGVALVVDRVTEVFGGSQPARRDVPRIGVDDAARGIAAVYAHRDTLVFVLDLERVAAVAEVLELPPLEGVPQ
jgi:purine-binding chemotaxis protein CheW